MNKRISDSELARAIAESPFHRAMLAHEDSSIARFGVEAEELAREIAEWKGDLAEKSDDDDEGPTLLYQRVGNRGWFKDN